MLQALEQPVAIDAAAPSRPPRWWYAALGLGLWLVYLPGGLCLITDAYVNVVLALSAVEQGDLWFDARELPEHFNWQAEANGQSVSVKVYALDEPLLRAEREGRLRAVHDDGAFRDVIVPTPAPGMYASTFCPGAGLTAVPVIAALRFVYPDLRHRQDLLWYAGKAVAAACVSGSAVLLFYCATWRLNPRRALALALAYALGTCVWSTSSQLLWQHGPTELFLMLGVTAWLRAAQGERTGWAAAAGLALSAATWCRPTSVLLLFCLAIAAALWKRRLFVPLLAAAAPLGLALAWYNWQSFGSPWRFGQTAITNVAEFKTGSAHIWQGTMLQGALGLMLSPSRGLLVFSPFVIFAFWGAARVLRESVWQAWRPLVWAVLAVWCVEFNHFDWWGGWSYGYRHIVDSLPLVCLLLAPVLDEVLDAPSRRRWFQGFVVWSAAVQLLGVATYCIGGWNGRPLTVTASPEAGGPDQTVMANVDLPAYHHRLWSLGDSQILYHLTHAPELVALKRKQTREKCQATPHELRRTHLQIAAALGALGEPTAAVDDLREVVDLWPDAARQLARQRQQSHDGNAVENYDWVAVCYRPGPTDRETPWQTRYHFGQLLIALGQGPAAVEQLGLALHDVPNHPEIVAALREATELLRLDGAPRP